MKTFSTSGWANLCRLKKTAQGQLIAIIDSQDLPPQVVTLLKLAGLSTAYLTDGNEIRLGDAAIVAAKSSLGYAYRAPDQVDVATVVKMTSEQPTASERAAVAIKDKQARAKAEQEEHERMVRHRAAQDEKDENDRRQHPMYRIQILEKHLIALRDRVADLEAKS